MKVIFGNENIQDVNHEFLEENKFNVMIDAVESLKIIDYYGIEKLLYLQEKYGLESDEMVNVIGFDLGVEGLNIPINAYNHEIINELVGGLEGIPMDILKTGWRATTGTIKAVNKAHKALYKNAKQLSARWNTNIKPLIIKFLKEFQAQLQIMWGKFRKYDKLYTKLGKEINSVSKIYINQINSMRSVSLFYHNFNPNALKGYAEAIKDYDAFMGSVTGSTELFGGKFIPPKEFANYLRSGNLEKAKECVDSMSAGMSKLNSRGDLAFAYAIVNNSDKNVSKSNFRKIKECFIGSEPEQILKMAIKNKSPLVEFVQVSILRKEVEGKYDEKSINRFKGDMFGSSGFLTIMSSVLNNRVIEKILTEGGKSIKDQTKEDLAAMEDIVRTGANSKQNSQPNTNTQVEKEDKARQTNDVTGKTTPNNSTTLQSEVENAENNTKNMQGDTQSEEINPFSHEEASEGFDFFKNMFSKSKKEEEKLVSNLTLVEYKKSVEKFFLRHKKILEDMLKPYSNTVKKYQLTINVPKYVEYDEIDDDCGGTLDISYSKALSYVNDYSDPDGEEVAKIIGVHPDGTDKFKDIIYPAFKKEFGFNLELDGDTDVVTFSTPSLKKITFQNKSIGSESEIDYFYNMFDQSSFIEGTEAGLSEALGYDADHTQTASKAAENTISSVDPSTGEMGIAELADGYIQTYSILMSKATSAYSSLVRGFLAATFTLCKEANIIIDEVYNSTGANRGDTNSAVSEDRPDENTDDE